ncbi:hypothetical protein P343_00505 [Sporolactobacillus laevolacticus DSM 442]|uniref:Uncharacterized protein n=1 Tax=Sporolactobacillus laevolacticus DSM 442 TaxID=1395513 RepID=V6J1A4_9BACL|nr:hypothetical protein P343_00505 [Sporolactobacillus laevolacticus DSM 442]
MREFQIWGMILNHFRSDFFAISNESTMKNKENGGKLKSIQYRGE